MRFEQAVRKLYTLMEKKWEKKYSLERIKRAFNYIYGGKEPFNTVLVAGTKGKGTTSTLIYRGLIQSGIKAGLFTSPHIVSIRERFQKNGRFITKDEFVNLVYLIFPLVERFNLTFFETVTLMATIFFKDTEWGIFEAGLGGRLDATNILNPHISVITRIGLDHTAILGETHTDIAREKAGIMRRGKVCFSGPQILKVKEFLYEVARSMDTEFVYLEGRAEGENVGLWEDKILAERVVEYITDKSVEIEDMYMPFRCDVVNHTPLIVLDIAHNPESFENLRIFMKRKKEYGSTYLILVLMRDKLVEEIFKTFDWVDTLIITSVCNRRARDIDDFPSFYRRTIRTPDILEALEIPFIEKAENIVFAGSIYMMETVVKRLLLKGLIKRELKNYISKFIEI